MAVCGLHQSRNAARSPTVRAHSSAPSSDRVSETCPSTALLSGGNQWAHVAIMADQVDQAVRVKARYTSAVNKRLAPLGYV